MNNKILKQTISRLNQVELQREVDKIVNDIKNKRIMEIRLREELIKHENEQQRKGLYKFLEIEEVSC